MLIGAEASQRSKLVAGLRRDAPTLLPGLVVVALLVAAAAEQGAYAPTVWYPGGLFAVLLAFVVIAAAPGSLKARRATWVALAGLAVLTLWSFASIAWASDRGVAWDGANRGLPYLALFALLALRPQRPRTAAWLLGAWALGMAGLALVTFGRLAHGAQPLDLFIAGRLAAPLGYVNATPAAWMMAFWPALLLAARPEVPWALRGLLAGAAVMLVDLTLLSQSRGALLATPVVLIAVFALVPGRTRTFATLVPVGAAVALTAPSLLRICDLIVNDRPQARSAVASAARPVVLAALAVAALVSVAGLLEHDRPPSPQLARRVHRALAALGLLSALGAVSLGVVLAGNPAARAQDAWHRLQRDYATPLIIQPGETRYDLGLRSTRYDFFRIGLKRFAAHPLGGIGADNFQQDYLLYGHTAESSRYPHSLEIRTLSQLGIVGGLALLVALGAGAVAAVPALRGADRLGRAVAGGALAACAYWVVHGSIDWFWEVPALAGSAWALLGLAGAIQEPDEGQTAARRERPRALRVAAVGGLGLVALAAVASLGPPALAHRNVAAAAQRWPADPPLAFARLDDAAALNPLTDQPHLVAGTIALRLGDLERARRAFAAALERNPRGDYAPLELGAIASQQGRPRLAKRYLQRARRVSPNSFYVSWALGELRAGRRIDVARLNRQLYLDAQKLRR